MSQLINTLSNQHFAGLDKFRLRESLEKMKDMHAQLVKVNKNNRNESNLSEFNSSLFSPAVPKPMSIWNISLPLAARKIFRENFFFTGNFSLLNMCIGEKKPESIKNWKRTVLGKDFKKQMKENKLFSLKLCQKKTLKN